MKKRIGILGSTGSVGSSLLNLIDKKKIEIIFLSANKNYIKLINQAKYFKVKNIIISEKKSYINALKENKDKKIHIFNSLTELNLSLQSKLDYVMSSITGIEGLKLTFEIIKYTKKIAIANKESIICAWPLLKNELKENDTKFIPVDSEHFSIWNEISKKKIETIDKIHLTASGGPLLNKNLETFKKKISVSSILNHPTWDMGKKISVDSATMMNKCFEIIEAKNIFGLKYNQIDILVHPDSYIHAIITYKNGLSKMILHDTTMDIPLFNSLYENEIFYKNRNSLDINKLNDLKFQKIDLKKYPIVKCLKSIKNKNTLYETVIVSVNDVFVNQFLNNRIDFFEISKLVLKTINLNRFKKYKNIEAKSVDDIIKLNNYIKKKLSNK